MPGPRRPTALVFCIADHPVFEALLTVCRDVAASGRGLRSADDYRRWWFVVTAKDEGDQVALPPDDPGLDDEDFIPGFTEGAIALLGLLDGFAEVAPIVRDKRPWCVASHARLTQEPLEDFVRGRGFDVLRPRDLLARDSNRPRSIVSDAFHYEGSIADALADENLSVSADDRIAFAYVLGELDELPPKLAPSETFFATVPELLHPSNWIAHDHRVFDVLCRARAFERISFHSYEARWGDSIHALARELQRRGAAPLEAFRGVLGRERTLPENLSMVAASARLRGSSVGERSELEREIDRAKRSLVSRVRELAFDGIGEAGGDGEVDEGDGDGELEEAEVQPRFSSAQQLRDAFTFNHYHLRSGWAHDDLLIAVGYPNLALRSTDAGNTWSASELPVKHPRAIDGKLLDDGRMLISVVGSDGVAFSWDRGDSWAWSRSGDVFNAVAVAADGRVCTVGGFDHAVFDDPAELRVHEESLGLEDVVFDGERFVAVSEDGSVLTYERDGWQRLATSMNTIPRALAVRERLMMVLAREGVATSEDDGQSWTWTPLDRLDWAEAAAIARDGARYLVGGQVLTSEDGERWRVMPVGDNVNACDIAITERAVMITSAHSIALIGSESSTALCFGAVGFAECPEHYVVAEHGFTLASLPAAHQVRALFSDADRVVLAIDEGLMLSEDRGRSWVAAVAPLRGRKVTSIVDHGGELWAACEGVVRSSDQGHSWVAVEAPLITKLITTVDGELFGVRGEWLLRRDLEVSSGWHVCRRFPHDIDALVSDESGAIYVINDELHASHDGGRSWISSQFNERIVGVVPTRHGLLACDRRRLHVSRDHGHSFESHPLELHLDSLWRGQVQGFCASFDGDLYFSIDNFLLHSTDLGRTLARVRAPFLSGQLARSVVELSGREYLLLDSRGLLERVDGSAVPEPRFVEVEVL